MGERKYMWIIGILFAMVVMKLTDSWILTILLTVIFGFLIESSPKTNQKSL
jgi:hypothetical protein